MRVLYINPAAQLGGAELSLLDLMATLPDAVPGVERHLLALAEGPLIDRATAMGVAVSMLPMPKALAEIGDSALQHGNRARATWNLVLCGAPAAAAVFRYVRSLRRLLHEIAPSHIHSNGIKAHLLLRMTGAKGIPVYWHMRDFVGRRPLVAHGLRWASKHATAAFAISNAVAHDAENVLGTLPVEAVYNAIDLARFSPGPGDGPRLDSLAGFAPCGDGIIRVGLVATYARWKGHNVFLKAAARVVQRSEVPTPRFYIVGGPIYETVGSQYTQDELRAISNSLQLGPHVGFIPFQEDTAAIYRALDLVVHASVRPEPFGRTIVEAMACARPVLVSAAGGAAELFTPGLDAVGFPPGNDLSLADTICALAKEPARCAVMGRAARQTAETRFNRARLGRQIAELYRRHTAVPRRTAAQARPQTTTTT